MYKTLILGGTRFIGRNLVEYMLGMPGYDISLCNRQQTLPNLFPGLRTIRADRETPEIQAIADEKWDYIIDLSCYYPDALENVLNHLAAPPRKYIFISTCSVYDHEKEQVKLRNEEAPVLDCNQVQRTDRTPASYGHRKAECERILGRSGIDHLILRPALVYGKYDPTDRLYYWLYQVKRNKSLLIPDEGLRRFSITYVNDLVQGILSAMKPGISAGACNLISTPEASIRQIIDKAGVILEKGVSAVNASPEFLRQHNISQWLDMPLWIDNDYYTYDNGAMLTRLNVKPTAIEDALLNTIKYFEALKWPEPGYGMPERRRKELLQIIHKDSLK